MAGKIYIRTDKNGVNSIHRVKPITKLKYCDYCRKQTPHKVVDSRTDGHGTGEDLRCTKCGSSRLGTIQGFDAALM